MSRSKTGTATRAPVAPVPLAEMRRPPTHPGEIFRTEFREPLGISQAEAARRLGIKVTRLNEIELGKRAVSPETAILFATLTGSSPEFWATLQARCDLWHAYQRMTTKAAKRSA